MRHRIYFNHNCKAKTSFQEVMSPNSSLRCAPIGLMEHASFSTNILARVFIGEEAKVCVQEQRESLEEGPLTTRRTVPGMPVYPRIIEPFEA